ncbi:FtsX-like permease family protein [Allokutzneria albata]|uniref:Putative ABC transport system permease protein n=1 Tax=Allokutzneria albata TaxID=211114 RepID=A0A1G9T1A5_ALLAB|nr:FtsX-like permease family protein [Allokutzneria albata]SDM41504.1 putative ABC transport system permease protein [Allokutzneria albata]
MKIAWQSVRSHRTSFVSAFLAVLGGVVLITACGVLLQSGLFAGIAPQRYAGAPVVVGASQSVTVPVKEDIDPVEWLPERAVVPENIVTAVATAPGVREVVGDVSFSARVVTQDNQVIGMSAHGWGSTKITPVTLSAGTAPATGEVVLGADFAKVGDRVRIATDGAPVDYRVSGLVPGGGLFFSDVQARALSRGITAVAAFPQPGVKDSALVANIEKNLAEKGFADRALVKSGVGRGEIEFLSAAQSRFVLMMVSGSFSGFVLMIVIFVVASTLSLMVHQRRREIALLRAIAATPRQIHRMLAAEVLVVTGAAIAIGLLPGYFLAYALRDGLAGIGVIAEGFVLSIGPVPALASAVACLAAARIAVWSAARRGVRVSPVEALRESTVERPEIGRTRTIIGCVLVGMALAAVVATGFVPAKLTVVPAGVSSLLAVIGIGLLGPKVMAILTRVAGARVLNGRRVSSYLAAANSTAGSRRLAAAVTPLVLTIGFATSQFYTQSTLIDATQVQARAATVADFVVTGQAGGVSASLAAAARDIPGVAASTPLVGTEVVAIDRDAVQEPLSRSTAYGVDSSASSALNLPVSSGAFADLRGDTVALSETEASWLGKRLGGRVELVLGDGTTINPRVAAVFEGNLGFGDVLLPADVVLPHTTDRLADAVLVSVAPNADHASVAAALRGLASQHPGSIVGDREALSVAQDNQLEANAWLNRLLLGLVLAYVALASATTLVTVTTGRAREFALLRLVGGTRRQIARMLRTETVIIVSIAVVLGTVVAAIPVTVLAMRLTAVPLPSGTPWVFAGIVAATVLTGVLSIRLPGRRVTRAHPLHSLRSGAS